MRCDGVIVFVDSRWSLTTAHASSADASNMSTASMSILDRRLVSSYSTEKTLYAMFFHDTDMDSQSMRGKNPHVSRAVSNRRWQPTPSSGLTRTRPRTSQINTCTSLEYVTNMWHYSFTTIIHLDPTRMNYIDMWYPKAHTLALLLFKSSK